jgi:flagellar biosynthetic protein FliS
MSNITQSDVADYYFRTQIETASKGKIICMLHERCIFFLLKIHSEAAEKKFFLLKVQNILTQLQLALRIQDPISQSLFYLYDYCYLCLEHGNEQDISNAIEILGMLYNTFRQLARKP